MRVSSNERLFFYTFSIFHTIYITNDYSILYHDLQTILTIQKKNKHRKINEKLHKFIKKKIQKKISYNSSVVKKENNSMNLIIDNYKKEIKR